MIFYWPHPVLESDGEEGHHDDKYFMKLLSVIEKFPELKIKTIELVANLARKGMCVPMGPSSLKISRFSVSSFRMFPIALLV